MEWRGLLDPEKERCKSCNLHETVKRLEKQVADQQTRIEQVERITKAVESIAQICKEPT